MLQAVLLSQRKYLWYLEGHLEVFNVFSTHFLKKKPTTKQKQTEKETQTHPTNQNKQLPSLCFSVKLSSWISGSLGQSLTAGQLGRLKKRNRRTKKDESNVACR